LNGSGVGVRIAARTNATRKMYRRCRASQVRCTTPMRTRATISAGISKTTPIPRMNVVTNERYSEQRSWFSMTALPKFTRNRRAFGSSR